MADNTIKLCECGCGQKTKLAQRTRSRSGHVRGQPMKFVNGHGRRSNQDIETLRARVESIDDAFGNYLAGFTDGEGCFYVVRNNRGHRYCGFRIALRADDSEILEEFHKITGLGVIQFYDNSVAWTVTSKLQCLLVVRVFERFKLRAKKCRDFEVWSQIVKLCVDHEYGGDWSEIDRLRDQLVEGRDQRTKVRWSDGP